MAKRREENWLQGLAKYVEETESPRQFWLWSGVFTLTSALQRKVWIPYGMDPIYPNLYVLLVASPGKRKGPPLGLAKRLLEDISIPVAADSSSKRALTQELAESAKTEQYEWRRKLYPMSTTTIISKEMSSLLAIDPKGLIEALTDLFDSADSWKYKTSGQGNDFLYNVCLNVIIATTPTWLASNLPQEAIGGGFTSRFVIVTGEKKYKRVAIPPPPDERLYNSLRDDLLRISHLVGEFKWGNGATAFFKRWYDDELPLLEKKYKDPRVAASLERVHILCLKTAMALRVAYSDSLVLEIRDLQAAIRLVEDALTGISEALGGHGASRLGPEISKVMHQIKVLKRTSFRELFSMNFQDLSRDELEEVLESLVLMGRVKKIFSNEDKDFIISWKGD